MIGKPQTYADLAKAIERAYGSKPKEAPLDFWGMPNLKAKRQPDEEAKTLHDALARSR